MKKSLNFWQIINMNIGFFGIQFSFGLQQSNMSPIYKYLGAEESELPILWLAGPVTGLIVQPIIGAISDVTWSPKWGRRKPFFLIGAIVASISLVLMPFSSTIWMAAGLLWILDAANNIALEPYRAFVSDKLPEKQYSFGFLIQSFFTGLGITLANFTPAILVMLGFLTMNDKLANGIPHVTYYAFFVGAAASLITILITVLTTSEIPPSEAEEKQLKEQKKEDRIIQRTWNDIVSALFEMPTPMKQLIPVMFFSWYAMFCYWQYLTSCLSLSLYNTTDQASPYFAQAQLLTGNLNGTYNIVCVFVAFAMIPIARFLRAKVLHCISLVIGGIGLLSIPSLSDQVEILSITNPFGSGRIIISQIYLYAIALGITWASMMSMPYQIVASSIPKNKMGVYMGIFNMFIVIPMIIQIITIQFGVYDLLGGNPINVVLLGGVFLILGGLSSLRIDQK